MNAMDRTRGNRVAGHLAAGGLAAATIAWPLVAEAQGGGAARQAAQQTDITLVQLRTLVVFAGLVVFAAGFWLRSSADPRLVRARLIALCLLGAVSYAGYYNWFAMSHTNGFARSDNFVYFVGSKYFDELGHDGLYECSLTAMEERGLWPAIPDRRVRDLETLEPVPEAVVRRAGADCPARFEPARWLAFGDDVAWFVGRWPPGYQYAVFHDYGYNATPAWIALGQIVTKVVDLDSEIAVWGLLHFDRLLVAATIACVGWAFGLEMAALLAIAWGSGFLWRYVYLGDSMLRFLWWSGAVLGVCALRRDRPAAAGIALVAASALRLFPAAMLGTTLVRETRIALAERRVGASARRFVVGLGAGLVVIIGLVVVMLGDGLGAFVSLAGKLSAFGALALPNQLGLASLVTWALPDAPAAAVTLRIVVLVGFLGLLWRALGRAERWEAAALGCAAIPMLATPPSYYLVSITVPLLLAARWPRIGISTLLVVGLLDLNGVAHYRQGTEFGPASLAIVLLCLHTAAEVAFARPLDAATADV